MTTLKEIKLHKNNEWMHIHSSTILIKSQLISRHKEFLNYKIQKHLESPLLQNIMAHTLLSLSRIFLEIY